MSTIPGLSVLSLLSLFGGVQALFIALYLLLKERKNKLVSNCLALILLGQFFLIYDYFICNNHLYEYNPHLVFFSYVFLFAYAPLIYLLIKAIVRRPYRLQKVDLFHFIPAILHAIYGIITFHVLSGKEKLHYIETYLSVLQAENGVIVTITFFFYLCLSLQFITYLYLSYRLVKVYSISRNLTHEISVAKLKWLFYSLSGIIFILLLSTLNLTNVLAKLSGIQELGLVVLLLLSLYLFYIAFFVVSNQEIFEKPRKKYLSSPLTETSSSEIANKLKQYMEVQKPYRQAELTINELAKQLQIPHRQLSQVINTHYGYNFYEFLNYYRILEAQQLFMDKQYNHHSILGVAYEIGFNSKSSFNTAFKKFTKMTPSAYRRKYQSDL